MMNRSLMALTLLCGLLLLPLGSTAQQSPSDQNQSKQQQAQSLPHEEAVRRLLAGSGSQFDPVIVNIFVPIAEQERNNVFAAVGTTSESTF